MAIDPLTASYLNVANNQPFFQAQDQAQRAQMQQATLQQMATQNSIQKQVQQQNALKIQQMQQDQQDQQTIQGALQDYYINTVKSGSPTTSAASVPSADSTSGAPSGAVAASTPVAMPPTVPGTIAAPSSSTTGAASGTAEPFEHGFSQVLNDLAAQGKILPRNLLAARQSIDTLQQNMMMLTQDQIKTGSELHGQIALLLGGALRTDDPIEQENFYQAALAKAKGSGEDTSTYLTRLPTDPKQRQQYLEGLAVSNGFALDTYKKTQSEIDEANARTQQSRAQTAQIQAQTDVLNKRLKSMESLTADNINTAVDQRIDPKQFPELNAAAKAAATNAAKFATDPQEVREAIEDVAKRADAVIQAKTEVPIDVAKAVSTENATRPGKVATATAEAGAREAVTGEALDREAKQFGAGYDKMVTDANNQIEKIQEAKTMINGNAEAQALGIPKVLTAVVSSAGSGVRITQPELNAIAKARGVVGDVQGWFNSVTGQGKLTDTQKQQLTGILDDVRTLVENKRQIASDASTAIKGAKNRDTIVAADQSARDKINAMESGPKRITSKADYAALPSGAQYIDTDGKTYTKK